MPDVYETIDSTELFQGDVIATCPLIEALPPARFPLDEGAQIDLDEEVLNVAVVSQTCDLVNGKARRVLVAPLISWPAKEAAWVAEIEAAHQENRPPAKGTPNSKARDSIREGIERGVYHHWHLFHEHTEPPLPWSVADLQDIRIINLEFLEAFLKSQAQPRLRLRSPFREHFSQKVAKYFMRVALPSPAKPFLVGDFTIR